MASKEVYPSRRSVRACRKWRQASLLLLLQIPWQVPLHSRIRRTRDLPRARPPPHQEMTLANSPLDLRLLRLCLQMGTPRTSRLRRGELLKC